MRTKQLQITNFFDSARDFYAREGAEQLYEYTNVKIDRPLPTFDLVRKRLGPRVARSYRSALEEAEDLGILYETDETQRMNSNCVRSRLSMLDNALEKAKGVGF